MPAYIDGGALISRVYLWERRRPELSWTLRDVTQLVVLGLFGVALNQFLFVVGLSRTSVAHSSIFANTTPNVERDSPTDRKMSRENPLWGASRIHGELFNLGIDIGRNQFTQPSKSRTYPRAFDIFEPAEWCAWLFLLDDQFDDGVGIQDVTEVTEVSQELLAMLPVDLGQTSRPSNGLAAADLWHRMATRMTACAVTQSLLLLDLPVVA